LQRVADAGELKPKRRRPVGWANPVPGPLVLRGAMTAHQIAGMLVTAVRNPSAAANWISRLPIVVLVPVGVSEVAHGPTGFKFESVTAGRHLMRCGRFIQLARTGCESVCAPISTCALAARRRTMSQVIMCCAAQCRAHRQP
jgi:hypothetical protein